MAEHRPPDGRKAGDARAVDTRERQQRSVLRRVLSLDRSSAVGAPLPPWHMASNAPRPEEPGAPAPFPQTLAPPWAPPAPAPGGFGPPAQRADLSPLHAVAAAAELQYPAAEARKVAAPEAFASPELGTDGEARASWAFLQADEGPVAPRKSESTWEVLPSPPPTSWYIHQPATQAQRASLCPPASDDVEGEQPVAPYEALQRSYDDKAYMSLAVGLLGSFAPAETFIPRLPPPTMLGRTGDRELLSMVASEQKEEHKRTQNKIRAQRSRLRRKKLESTLVQHTVDLSVLHACVQHCPIMIAVFTVHPRLDGSVRTRFERISANWERLGGVSNAHVFVEERLALESVVFAGCVEDLRDAIATATSGVGTSIFRHQAPFSFAMSRHKKLDGLMPRPLLRWLGPV
eukprot:scaffold69_cov248-Pinguiococcus_pyrenoidosus.AAC.71